MQSRLGCLVTLATICLLPFALIILFYAGIAGVVLTAIGAYFLGSDGRTFAGWLFLVCVALYFVRATVRFIRTLRRRDAAEAPKGPTMMAAAGRRLIWEANGNYSDAVDYLSRLAKLRSEGAITEEEFAALKRKLMP